MEDKINIAEILRDMPKGTKLYSPLFGKCELVDVGTDEGGDFIRVEFFSQDGYGKDNRTFSSDGRYFERLKDTECLLFPSDRMRSWSKFFKRGDVLFDDDMETAVIFKGWVDEDYVELNTTINHYKISDDWDKGDICRTLLCTKATNEERAKFIAAAEKHYGGKYNPETLQVEPVKVAEPKCSFKPFDKVLVRYNEDSVWRCELFSHYNTFNKRYPYVCLSGVYKYCIHYEGNQHLLGTDKSPE